MPRLYCVLQANTDVCAKITAYSACVWEGDRQREWEMSVCWCQGIKNILGKVI